MKATYGFRAAMKAVSGKGDELAAALMRAVEPDGPASHPACLFFVVTRSLGERDVVHVIEGWTSREAHAENFARAQSQAFTATLAPLVADATYGDDVPVGGKFTS
jgi:quinol monooxygenase YgiN